MSIWNKVLVGLIILASLGFVWLAMSALKTHQYWGQAVGNHEKKLVAVTDEVDKLRYGNLQENGVGGLRAFRTELHKYLIGRGRVWYNCTPQPMANPQEAQQGHVTVVTDQPVPHGISANMILYVFEEKGAKEGGRFLGEFKVLAVDEQNTKSAVLEPTVGLLPEELKALTESRGPWTIRERLPTDSLDMFAGVNKEDLTKMIPANRVDAYAKAGQEGNDRSLRDYRVLIKSYEKQRALAIETHERAARYLQAVEKSLAAAKTLVQSRQTELTALAADVKEATRERDAAVAYQKALVAEAAQRQARIQELLAQNRALAEQIAKFQTEAAREIDQRTAVVRQ